MQTFIYTRFSQTNTDGYGTSAYGGSAYGCAGTDCVTTTVTPGAPNTGFGLFPNIAAASPVALVSLGIILAIIVASSVLIIKRILRKHRSSIKSSVD